MSQTQVEDFKKAEKGAIISIAAYTIISIFKIVVGKIGNSEALSADGFNNFTDIISSFTVLIGLRLAQKPADHDHRYGHWKIENVASLVTSIIMFIVGTGVILSSFTRLVDGKITKPDLLAAIIGLISGIVMLVVYFINRKLAKIANSSALRATSKDNRNDSLTSIGTAIAIFAATLGLSWVDGVTAIIVGLLILRTAIGIFKESAFYLSDGFDDRDFDDYIIAINDIKGVGGIKSIKGRSSGSNIYLDLIIAIDPEMSVRESHAITEQIRQMLQEKFNIYDVDVHVEPDE
ncbi:cation diffusion facilitator family transporter [Xylocopilactobacillus apis]|uniref:Cation diffusion facilitator family transporter n=1 Tax=Xylocopilactobacillus apis TaxID=2932183 RepID=A0AAU9D4V5_9LACO|nr:cation diffusion facilitator family transporter [Xylocopilactobacillus apis]BDR57320.1 hypothetical protein KIMC2_18820 [Xylocopilactobacillus apis]